MKCKYIPGYENYFVTDTGRVFNKNFKELYQDKNKYGYNYVSLYNNCKRKNFRVHRLVAMLFVDNPNNFSFVNHKNENKRDNRASNLEWCSKVYNCNYGTAKNRLSNHRKDSPKVYRIAVVRCFDNKYYDCFSDTKEDGYNPCHVSEVCRGIRKTNNGDTFRYATNDEIKIFGKEYSFVKSLERG